MKENHEKEPEVQANTEPLSGKDKTVLRIIIAICVIAIVGTVAFFGIRYGLYCKNMKTVALAIKNTVKGKGETTYTSTYDDITVSGRGGYIITDSEKCGRFFFSDGNRGYFVTCDIYGNTAYTAVDWATDSDFMSVDISPILCLLGKDAGGIDWLSVINRLSFNGEDVSEYYNASEMDEAMEEIRKKLTDPVTLGSIVSCKKQDNVYYLEIDMYELLITSARCTRDIFVNEENYKSLLDVIEEDKKALNNENVDITLTITDDVVTKADIISHYDGKTYKTEISFKESAGAYDRNDFYVNPDLCENVTLDVAYNRIKRAGIDSDEAYDMACRASDMFSTVYSYSLSDGTIILIYDENGILFQFAYQKKKIQELIYGDDLYNAWEKNSYVELNSVGIDIFPYTVKMYEPTKTAYDENDPESYNYAYLDAVTAYKIIRGYGYKMTENAIFVVTENDKEYQFVYQEGDLYNVPVQYYYYIETAYGKADVSFADGLPDNVELYIPNSNDK